MKDTDRKTVMIFFLCGMIPVVWLGLLAAPYTGESIFEMLAHMNEIIDHPLNIRITENSGKTVLIFLSVYVMSIGIYLATKRNYRKGEEHGSAEWGNANTINKRYEQKPPEANKILTQHVRIGLDGRKHKRNLNVLVIGGSGAGKTRFYCKPNVLQAETSLTILDPNGKIVLL